MAYEASYSLASTKHSSPSSPLADSIPWATEQKSFYGWSH